MVQRLGLAVAMIPDADILLLDEPTAALDPDGLRALYPVIEQRRRDGAAVLFSSHQLGDVERLADRIAVMANGKLIVLLAQRELAAILADRGRMRVRVAGSVATMLLERIRACCPQATAQGDELIVPGTAASRPAVLDLIRNAGVDIVGLTTEEGRLEELYRELVERES
jgi:Cu-processing system ATP-binding protein